jgi:hypothetical protein
MIRLFFFKVQMIHLGSIPESAFFSENSQESLVKKKDVVFKAFGNNKISASFYSGHCFNMSIKHSPDFINTL